MRVHEPAADLRRQIEARYRRSDDRVLLWILRLDLRRKLQVPLLTRRVNPGVESRTADQGCIRDVFRRIAHDAGDTVHHRELARRGAELQGCTPQQLLTRRRGG